MAADTETLQNAAVAHSTPTMERRASHWGRASQSHIVPHVLTSGAICDSNRGRTLSAALKFHAGAMPDVTEHCAPCRPARKPAPMSTNELKDTWCDGCNYVRSVNLGYQPR